jgi:2-polyprenyl-3-methyl-5-hydroxy-6-metoxy-1,4-benzoquinol methylase
MFDNNNCAELKECLACGSNDIELALDLNMQPLANSYKLDKNEVQEEFPLAINHCNNCHHVQLTHAVHPDLMFKDYLYVSGTSATMKEYFKWFANYTKEYYSILFDGKTASNVLDIGCNDGTQLDYFVSDVTKTYGIDPAENLAETSKSKGHKIYVGYFDENFPKAERSENESFYDIIVAQNVFAHNYDPITFLKTAKDIMNENSLMFIQTSQADMILNNEFDTIYHEHISFYNINSMNELCKRCDLNLFDVIKSPLHGNSYVFVITKNMSRPANIANHIEMEKKAGLLNNRTYEIYRERCEKVAVDFRNAIYDARKQGFVIVGYGAAAKGMTVLNYTKVQLDYIVDDNPLKQNRYTPGSSVPILAWDNLPIADTDKVLFVPLAWNFFDEIKSKIMSKRIKIDDKFLKYFPKVEYTE